MSNLPPFKNEPPTDFSEPDNVAAFQKAIDLVRSQLGRKYPLHIGGEDVTPGEVFVSTNPSRPNEVIGVFAKGRQEDAERAIDAAATAFETWRYVDPEQRARY